MVQWIHTFWWKRRLKKSLNDPNKMDLATKYEKSHALTEIQQFATGFLKELEFLTGKIKNWLKKKLTILNSTESNENRQNTQLVFTEYEKQHLKSQNKIYLFLVFLFIFAEGGFYYLTLESIMKGDAFIIPRILIAIALAVFIMYALDWSIEQHFKYDEMKSKVTEYNLNEYSLKKYRDSRTFGYVIIFFVMAVIIAAGVLRIVFLESKDTTGYSLERIERMQRTDFWQSVLTFSLTFLFGLFMGLFKRNKYAELMRYKVYKSWSIANKKLTEYTKNRQNLIESKKVLLDSILEKHWQLVLETRRFYKIEYDSGNTELYNEFLAEKNKGVLVMNPELYQKYERIQCVDEKTFKYGIMEEEIVKNIFKKINASSDEIEKEEEKLYQIPSTEDKSKT